MTGWTRFACCTAAPGPGFWVAPDGALPLLPLSGPELASGLPEPEPCIAAAAHEAGHAVAAVSLGGRCQSATIKGQPHAVTTVQGPAAQVTVALAGDVGDLAHRRMVHRPLDAEIMSFLFRADAGCAGSCDLCRAARLLVLMAPHRNLDAALVAFRAIETATITLMNTPRVRTAVGRVAAVLERDGTVAGNAVHAICDELVITDQFNLSQ